MINIAIDGPAGAGKSTIAKALAKELSIIYVDTGAMYRAIGYYVKVNNDFGFDPKQDDAQEDSRLKQYLEEHIDEISIDIEYVDGTQHIFLNGNDVSDVIRTPEIGTMASIVSANTKVRLYGVKLQKELAKKSDVVMDGRDIGTFVLPDSPLKIYLTASSEVRAKRRFDQLVEKGEEPDMTALIEEIESRDYRDMNRNFAPLKKADDAIEVDTSDMTIDEVIETLSAMSKTVYG